VEDHHEPHRDLVFELVITKNFNLRLDDKAAVESVRGKANWIASWWKGNAVKKSGSDKKRSLPGCSPAPTLEHIAAFYSWWDRVKKCDKPQTALGVAQFYGEYMATTHGSKPPVTDPSAATVAEAALYGGAS